VAALLHDIGIFVSLRGHHKHGQYILSVSEIFGLSRDDMAVISNVARYHRRGTPNKSHLRSWPLDSEDRVLVNKLGAILRVANALDADHLQKVRDVRVLREEDQWVLEVDGGGDMTLERLAALARSDMLVEVFGRKLAFREGAAREEGAKARARAVPSTASCRGSSSTAASSRRPATRRTRSSSGSSSRAFVASNLDEFFMVRVAALQNAIVEGDAGPTSPA